MFLCVKLYFDDGFTIDFESFSTLHKYFINSKMAKVKCKNTSMNFNNII